MTEQLVADRALAEILLSDYGAAHADRGLSLLKPWAGDILKRAQAEGELRRDITANDIPALLGMTTAVAGLTAPVRPAAWRRYLLPLLDGLRADGICTRLPAKALSDAELDSAVRAGSAGDYRRR